ncbi:ciliogenesis-associated TTC17-interacting protein [Microcaecilia unicolor]|uniref:Ciliogenesis-associated TTC17-interacting protein n=1 Tax=Microcaecilia unicolor TaxID=1415580 RepID=A0A6P7YKF7_9AMPH|nr:ciliogenesis-associated TTC17-interacting protein [Microcaecilia unicolor]
MEAGSEEERLTMADELNQSLPEKASEESDILSSNEEKTETMAEEPKTSDEQNASEEAEEKTETMAEEPKTSDEQNAREEAGLEEETLTVPAEPFAQGLEEETPTVPEEPFAQGLEEETLTVPAEPFAQGLEEETPTVPEEPEASVQLTANQNAMEFLRSVGEDELLLSAFSETLGCFSDSGAQIGEFTVTMQPAIYKGDEDCYLIHITSHSTVDDFPCNTSIFAYISKKLETLEQQHQEYIKMKNQLLDKKTHMVKQGDKLIVERFITEGELVKHRTTSYPWKALEGFVSEASNVLILRILAKRREVPESMIFLVFDTETNLCQSTYNEMGLQKQTIEKDVVDVYGIERTIQSEVDLPITWQSYFLSDGHMSSRVQVGSPTTMKVLKMPVLIEKEVIDPKPTFGKQPLNWETDAQLYSQFLDRKEELSADHASYIRRHPEMRLLLSDFLQFLLLRKPDDVITFAAEYFAPFSAGMPLEDTFRTSNKPSPFRDSS